MSSECLGWTIKCPDGKLRHPPFHNEGDADCDAGVHTDRNVPCPDPATALPSDCPAGKHTVEPVAFKH